MTNPTPEQMRALASDRPWTAAEESEWNFQVRAALRAAADQLEAVRRYADDRSYHAARPNNLVSSWRIASDLNAILTVDTAPRRDHDEP